MGRINILLSQFTKTCVSEAKPQIKAPVFPPAFFHLNYGHLGKLERLDSRIEKDVPEGQYRFHEHMQEIMIQVIFSWYMESVAETIRILILVLPQKTSLCPIFLTRCLNNYFSTINLGVNYKQNFFHELLDFYGLRKISFTKQNIITVESHCLSEGF